MEPIPQKEPSLDFNLDSDILAVDDNDFNLYSIIQILENKYNLKARKAYNGQDAIRIVEESELRFKLIIMDINMPILDGIQSTKAIKNIYSKARKEVNIVFLTSFDENAVKKECMEAGGVEVVTKPCTQKKLGDLLRKYYL